MSPPADALDDATLVARFEALALAPRDFGHREHLRVAFAMLRDADFGDAAVRYRAALQRFASHAGAPAKYHETITWAYLAILHQRMAEARDPTSGAFLARHPELLEPARALDPHYDLGELLASSLARRVLVLPVRR